MVAIAAQTGNAMSPGRMTPVWKNIKCFAICFGCTFAMFQYSNATSLNVSDLRFRYDLVKWVSSYAWISHGLRLPRQDISCRLRNRYCFPAIDHLAVANGFDLCLA